MMVKNELVVVNGGWLKLSCYEQNAENLLSDYTLFGQPYASHYDRQGLAIGDINNDGANDILTAHSGTSGLVILYNANALKINDERSDRLRIYPNPTTDNIYIDLTFLLPQQAVSIQLSDLQGKQIFSESVNLNDPLKKIDLNNCAAGIYTLKVQTEDAAIVKKIIRQ